jgi:valyl-tRNA synthetase
MDRWILARTGAAVAHIRDALDGYRFDTAAAELYAFVWYELCDWYLEFSKPALYGEDGPAKDATRYALWSVFHAVARLLHPFMPFLSEELWRNLPGTEGSVIRAAFPRETEFPADAAALEAVAAVQQAIVEVRRIRADVGIGAREALVASAPAPLYARLAPYAANLQSLASFTVVEGEREGAGAVAIVAGEQLFVRFPDTVDLARERERLTKEIAKVRKSRDFYASRIANTDFMGRAPEKLREETLGGHAADVAKLAALEAALAALGPA